MLSYKVELQDKYILKFDPLCLDGFDMFITELNIITQMQHQLRSERQLT